MRGYITRCLFRRPELSLFPLSLHEPGPCITCTSSGLRTAINSKRISPKLTSRRKFTIRHLCTCREPMHILAIRKGISRWQKKLHRKSSLCPCTLTSNFVNENELSRKSWSRFPYSEPAARKPLCPKPRARPGLIFLPRLLGDGSKIGLEEIGGL